MVVVPKLVLHSEKDLRDSNLVCNKKTVLQEGFSESLGDLFNGQLVRIEEDNLTPILIVASIAVEILELDGAHWEHYRPRNTFSLWYRRKLSSGAKRRGVKMGAFSNRHNSSCAALSTALRFIFWESLTLRFGVT